LAASLALFAAVGLAEWMLAIWRLRLCVSGRAAWAACAVAAETLLGLWVFARFAAGDVPAGIAYALGGALGTWLGVRHRAGTGRLTGRLGETGGPT
jgi:hypothetical protein